MIRRSLRSTFFPYTTLFRSWGILLLILCVFLVILAVHYEEELEDATFFGIVIGAVFLALSLMNFTNAFQYYMNPEWYAIKLLDRKSTRLNSSHVEISYAVFC